ncbi:MAG: hypothetical protein KA715_12050 [Xanthomonadaceae bacterium]|nr:hypothetical protein [Xanthomonadaceae bacterium]
MMKKIIFLALTTILASPLAHATKWSNQFVEFELPAKWQCSLEGAEFVCQSMDEFKKKDAIIILAAKHRGPQDSLDQYTAYLKKQKDFKTKDGKTLKSDVKYARNLDLNGHTWADSLHLESEVAGFFTRYLATIKEDIGVLVTYSVNKAKYPNYQAEFDNMVKTLRVFRKPGGLNSGASSNLFAQAKIPGSISETAVFGNGPDGEAEKKEAPKEEDNNLLFLVGGAILIYVFIKRRKKNV